MVGKPARRRSRRSEAVALTSQLMVVGVDELLDEPERKRCWISAPRLDVFAETIEICRLIHDRPLWADSRQHNGAA